MFPPCCINQYKNTNLKANHNHLGYFRMTDKLYQPIQKYKFESKSQHKCSGRRRQYCCINQYKNTNLKANHNCWKYSNQSFNAVSTNTKIQIWKQITTVCVVDQVVDELYQPIQKYKFESKSQLSGTGISTNERCINQYKNTNLKANHNQ